MTVAWRAVMVQHATYVTAEIRATRRTSELEVVVVHAACSADMDSSLGGAVRFEQCRAAKAATLQWNPNSNGNLEHTRSDDDLNHAIPAAQRLPIAVLLIRFGAARLPPQPCMQRLAMHHEPRV